MEIDEKLILYVISFVQNNKHDFQSFMISMFGKEYSIEEIKDMMTKLREDINIERFSKD